MGIFLIICIIICLCWPWIMKWLRGFMARRMEDMTRRMMGMPSRGEERRRAREEQKRQRASSKRTRGFHHDSGARRHRAPSQRAADLLQAVAVDATYTEVREFSDKTTIHPDGSESRTRVYREEQVSDAVYTEIKEKHKQS